MFKVLILTDFNESHVFAKGHGDHMHDERSRLLLQMNFESPFNNSGTLPEFERKVKQ